MRTRQLQEEEKSALKKFSGILNTQRVQEFRIVPIEKQNRTRVLLILVGNRAAVLGPL